MKYAIEMDSGGMIYIPSLVQAFKICMKDKRRQQDDLISLLAFLKIRKSA
jgi:hypothetical protein